MVLEGIPGLISHPRVRLGVCVQSWYAVAVMKPFFFFLVPSWFFFVKSNQPQCDWKSKWNLSYLFLRASLWFLTKKNTAASAHRDDLVIKHGWASACSPSLLRRNGKLSNKNALCKRAPFQKWSWHVELSWKDNLISSISSSSFFFLPYPVFTLNPPTILSFLPSSALPLHPHFTFKHFPRCFIQSYFIFFLSMHNFPIRPLPSPIATYYVFSLFSHASIYPSIYWSLTAIHPSVSKAKQECKAAVGAPGPLLSALPPGMLHSQWGYWLITHPRALLPCCHPG